MTSTSETGHAKNVANFELFIACCGGNGAAYSPSKNALKIPQMQTTLTNGKNVLQTVKTTEIVFENNRNSREINVSPAILQKFSTRILNALEATDASKQTINNAKAINRKIHGKRAGSTKKAKTTKPEATATPASSNDSTTTSEAQINQISVSQLSFDSLIDNFAKLVVLLGAEPLYIPNEADLKVTALNTDLAYYRTLNSAVITSSIPYKDALIARDITLYQDNTGLVDIALAAKKYIKSVYGATSPQYKQVSAIAFKKIKKKKK